MMGSAELIALKVDAVFLHLLNSPDAIHDETHLDKLIEWVISLHKSSDFPDKDLARVILSSSSFRKLFKHCTSETAFPGPLVLCLRLCPVASEDESILAKEDVLLLIVKTPACEAWTLPLVRNDWLKALTGLVISSRLCTDDLSDGLLNTVLDLLSDTSIFVRSSASLLVQELSLLFSWCFDHESLKQCIITTNESKIYVEDRHDLPLGITKHENSACNGSSICGFPTSQTRLIRIFKFITNSLENELDFGRKRSIWDVLIGLFRRNADIASAFLRRKDFLERIHWLLDDANGKSVDASLPVEVVKIWCDIENEEETVNELTQHIFQRGSIEIRVKFASWLFARKQHDLAKEILLDNLSMRSQGDKRDEQRKLLHCLTALKEHKLLGDEFIGATLCCLSRVNIENGWSAAFVKKIRLIALDILSSAVHETTVERSTMGRISKECIELLNGSTLDAVVYNKSLVCLSHVLTNEGLEDIIGSESGIVNILQKRLVDVRWEVRDSTLEFFINLLQGTKGDLAANWLSHHSLFHAAWQCMDDSESYVRATATSVFYYLSLQMPGQHVSTILSSLECCPWLKLQQVLRNETEAFCRRNAIKLLCCLQSKNLLSTWHVAPAYEQINSCIQDLDWEIKSSVINFWGQFWADLIDSNTLDDSPQEPNAGTVLANGTEVSSSLNSRDNYQQTVVGALIDDPRALEVFCKLGAHEALLKAAEDHDSIVQTRACSFLVRLAQQADRRTKWIGDEGLEAVKLCNCSVAQMNTNRGVKNDVDNFAILLTSNVWEQRLKYSSESIDEYDRCPSSVLDDILAHIKSNDEDNVIDCY